MNWICIESQCIIFMCHNFLRVVFILDCRLFIKKSSERLQISNNYIESYLYKQKKNNQSLYENKFLWAKMWAFSAFNLNTNEWILSVTNVLLQKNADIRTSTFEVNIKN